MEEKSIGSECKELTRIFSKHNTNDIEKQIFNNTKTKENLKKFYNRKK